MLCLQVVIMYLTFYESVNIDELVKSRHTRECGYTKSIQLFEKTGFPFPCNDKNTFSGFLRIRHYKLSKMGKVIKFMLW